MTTRDVTGFCACSSPGNRAIFSIFCGYFLTKKNAENLEKKEKNPLEKTQKKTSGDGAPKLQLSVPCRGRTCPEKIRRLLGGGQFSVLSLLFGDEFGESLGGSQAPPSFWEVPGLPRKFPELPRKFFGDFPRSSLTVELN